MKQRNEIRKSGPKCWRENKREREIDWREKKKKKEFGLKFQEGQNMKLSYFSLLLVP